MQKIFCKTMTTLAIFALALVVCSSTVLAKPKEGNAQIKQLVSSKNFYLAYGYAPDVTKRKLGYSGKAIAVSGKQMMTYAFGLSYKPTKLSPEYYTNNGEYFKFLSPKQVIYYTSEQMEDIYINPKDGGINETKKIFENLLPPELAMFRSSSNITFVDSGSCVVNFKDKVLDYERYSQPLKNALGQDVKVKYYYVYYDKKGSVLGVDTIVVEPNDNANKILNSIVTQKKLKKEFFVMNLGKYQFTRLVVSKFNNKVPKDFKKINKKTKFVEPWVGDMNELIEQRVPTEVSINN